MEARRSSRCFRPSWRGAGALVVCLGLAGSSFGAAAGAQEVVELFTPDTPIPEAWYESWSLFLPRPSIMFDYPGSFVEPSNYSVWSLNGIEAAEAIELLTELAERIVEGRILEEEPESEEFWNAWRRLFTEVRDVVVGFSQRVTVKIKSRFFEVELEP